MQTERHRQIARQWEILRALDRMRIGITINQLAAECGVTRRTIYRDLEDLQAAGFPLYNEPLEGGSHNEHRWLLLTTRASVNLLPGERRYGL